MKNILKMIMVPKSNVVKVERNRLILKRDVPYNKAALFRIFTVIKRNDLKSQDNGENWIILKK